ncbi:MAG: hypothetical protein ACREN7_03325, partial [Candidatus Dormibacteria bacterium]
MSVYLASEETAHLAAIAERERTSQPEVSHRDVRLHDPNTRATAASRPSTSPKLAARRSPASATTPCSWALRLP